MNEKVLYLKIKIKSLAVEAKLIRLEERKVKGLTKHNLSEHRKHVVRPEARATLLAYGFLRGRDYRSIESNATTKPDWTKVKSMVKRYTDLPVTAAKQLDEWIKIGIS